MLHDKERDLEFIAILKDQLEYLKSEIAHKNLVINDLLSKVRSNDTK